METKHNNLKVGQTVTVYDRYRLVVPVLGTINELSSTDDAIFVELSEVTNSVKKLWVHALQAVPLSRSDEFNPHYTRSINKLIRAKRHTNVNNETIAFVVSYIFDKPKDEVLMDLRDSEKIDGILDAVLIVVRANHIVYHREIVSALITDWNGEKVDLILAINLALDELVKKNELDRFEDKNKNFVWALSTKNGHCRG